MAATHTDLAGRRTARCARRCGLLDRSERGKLALSGAGAVEFLNGQVTNELADLRAGEGRYAAFLTHKGKMLGDLRILAVGASSDGSPAELLLDTERVALQALFDMIRRFKVGYDVELHKRTLERGLLSLIGPGAAPSAGAERASASCRASTPTRRVRDRRRRRRSPCAPTSGVDLLCDAADTERSDAGAASSGRSGGRRASGRVPARRARPPALRHRHRRQRRSPRRPA